MQSSSLLFANERVASGSGIVDRRAAHHSQELEPFGLPGGLLELM